MKALPTVLLLLPPLAVDCAAAEPCLQEKALYRGPDGYVLGFVPVGSEAAAVSHRFEMTKDAVTFTGFVMESSAPLRSIARLEKDCPEGDATGADLAACTAHEGYVYAVSATGEASNMPTPTAPAAAHLLISGLGPSLAAAPVAVALKLTPPSGDFFTLQGCTP